MMLDDKMRADAPVVIATAYTLGRVLREAVIEDVPSRE